MRTTLLIGAALFAASASPAFAGDFDVTLEGFAAQVDADATFINADKLPNELSGVFEGVRIGAEYTTEPGLFFGANYYTTLAGEITSEPVRNGNYLVHYTTLAGFSGWEVNAGWDFGHIAAGVGYGSLTRDVTTYQSCSEDHDAVPFGFCGSVAFGDAREGLRGGSPEDESADSWRVFGRYDVTEHFALTASYQTADFGQSLTPLDVVANAENTAAGNRTAHGPTAFAQDFRAFSIGAQVRF